MVVMALPVTADTGVEQARMGSPSAWTVQAPHSAMPQPNFVPTRPSESRKTHNRGVFGSTSAVRALPLTRSWMLAMEILVTGGHTLIDARESQILAPGEPGPVTHVWRSGPANR